MLRITVEIVPFGIESEKRTIATMLIANIGTNSKNIADYEVELLDEQDNHFFGKVCRYNRKNGALNLIYKALQSMGFKGKL